MSIYDTGNFIDESFNIKHHKKYMLTMYKKSRNANGSQFMITFDVIPQWDGEYVAFGEAISGFETLKMMEEIEGTLEKGFPLTRLLIVDSGEIKA